MEGEQLVRSDSRLETDQLATAYEHLGKVLETVDFANEPALAEAVLDAVRATDRAYQLTTS